MNDRLESIWTQIPFDCFTDVELSSRLSGSPHVRYSFLKRAIARGDLIHVKKGLYCFPEKFRRKPLNLFSVAQKIQGPSYISLESALSHHGWIPEAVYTVTSVCMRRSKYFSTPLGLFSYRHIPPQSFFYGVESLLEERERILMASPWKALADYVYVYKKDWKSFEPLIESLRIEEENLRKMPIRELEELEKIYASRRVKKFLKGLRRELS